MSLKVDKVQLEIIMKSDTTRAEIIKLEDQAKSLQKEMKKLKNNPEELAKASAEYDKVKNRMTELRKTIGLTGMTMRELQQRQKELNMMMRSMDPRTEKYAEYRKELTQVNARMRELRGSGQAAESAFSKLAGGFNKFGFMITSVVASITGLSLTFRKLAEDIAKLDDTYSDVMKTTGNTREEVLALNEEFKKMDTRTSREQLNLLARDAGKLGLSSKKDIMDFVEAGNQINVALGEDLGEDAIKNIGKLVGVFEKSTDHLRSLNLKEQMLAVGSAINELGASSTASEPYMVQFMGRLGGVAAQAGISADAIMGYASALDQDMQAVEMSATALQNFIMKIMGDPAKFARIAGLEVQAFTDLLKTDANSAIKQVLGALNEKGGFQQLIPVFQEMGLDGARAVGVLSSMAGSIDKIDEAQRVANKAMTEGTSLTNEYNIKNENLAARLDKARKNFKEVSLELGQSLNPVLLKSTNATSYLIRLMVELPKWLNQNKTIIITLAAIWTAYTVAVNASIIADKLKIFWTDKVVLSVTKLTSAIKANPWGLIATGVVLAVSWLNKYLNKQNEVNKSQQDFLDLAQRTSDFFASQQDLQQRFNVRGSLSKSQLESLSGDLSMQISELEKVDADIKAKSKTVLENDYKLKELNAEYEKANKLSKLNLLWRITQRENDLLGEYAKEFSQANSMLKTLRKNKDELDKMIAAKPDSPSGSTSGSISGSSTSAKGNPWDSALEDAEYAAKEQEIIYLQMLKNKLVNEEQYNVMSEMLALDLLRKKKSILEDHKQDTIDIQKQILEAEIKQGDLTGSIKQGKLQGLSVAGVDMDELNKGLALKLKEIELKKEADEAYFAWKKEQEKNNREGIYQIVEASVGAVMALHELEASSLEEQKQRELAAAGDNAEAREAIEKKYAQKELELKKKQANADMAVKIASAVANAAMAITEIWSKHASNPVIAGILTGLSGATTLMQIANIKKQRDIIMATSLDASGSSSSAITSGSRTPNSQLPVTPQAADGRWDVVGADDLRTYRNVPYRGIARTGIVSRPTLMGERGDELIIDNPTLRNIRMNAPGLISEVMRMRVRQRASGKWDTDTASGDGGLSGSIVQLVLDENTKTMQEVASLLRWLRENRIEAYTVLSEFEKKRDLRDKSVRKGSL